MPSVALTDTVTIRYTATLENGELIEATDKPMTLTIGSGTVCPAVEACLFGMEPGQTRVICVQPDDAYGLRQPELVQTIPLAAFKNRIMPAWCQPPSPLLRTAWSRWTTTIRCPVM